MALDYNAMLSLFEGSNRNLVKKKLAEASVPPPDESVATAGNVTEDPAVETVFDPVTGRALYRTMRRQEPQVAANYSLQPGVPETARTNTFLPEDVLDPMAANASSASVEDAQIDSRIQTVADPVTGTPLYNTLRRNKRTPSTVIGALSDPNAGGAYPARPDDQPLEMPVQSPEDPLFDPALQVANAAMSAGVSPKNFGYSPNPPVRQATSVPWQTLTMPANNVIPNTRRTITDSGDGLTVDATGNVLPPITTLGDPNAPTTPNAIPTQNLVPSNKYQAGTSDIPVQPVLNVDGDPMLYKRALLPVPGADNTSQPDPTTITSLPKPPMTELEATQAEANAARNQVVKKHAKWKDILAYIVQGANAAFNPQPGQKIVGYGQVKKDNAIRNAEQKLATVQGETMKNAQITAAQQRPELELQKLDLRAKQAETNQTRAEIARNRAEAIVRYQDAIIELRKQGGELNDRRIKLLEKQMEETKRANLEKEKDRDFDRESRENIARAKESGLTSRTEYTQEQSKQRAELAAAIRLQIAAVNAANAEAKAAEKAKLAELKAKAEGLY